MNRVSNFVIRARVLRQKLLVLLGPETKRRWTGLIALAIFVSLLEAIAAALIYVLLSALTGSTSETTLPLVGNLDERFPQLSEDSGILVAAVILGVFFVVRALVYALQSYLQNRVAHATSAHLARRLLRGYLAMPYQAFVSRNSAELIRNAHQSTESLAFWVLFPGILLASETFVILALCAVLITTSPVVAAGTLAFLGIIVMLMLKLVQPRLQILGSYVQDLTTESLKSLQQTLLGLRDIRMLGKEEFFEEQFGAVQTKKARAYTTRGLLIDIPRITLETSVLVALLVFIGLRAARGSPVGEGTTVLGMFGYAALRVLPSTNRIVSSLQSLRFAVPLIHALHQDVVAAEERGPAALAGASAGPATDFQVVSLDDVRFRYPDSDRDALANIDLEIRRGESLGIVGPTGSGKSTLLDIVLGLIAPTQGRISVDGRALDEMTATWQRNIGLVPQTVFLLDDSIRRNVALGIDPDHIDQDRLAEAIEIAQLGEFVAGLPAGLETVVGERGVKLSGGQRQRIAIARALYMRPLVLVFDEGTSALDGKTEAHLFAALSQTRPETTLISVAHRVGTIQKCDRIVVIIEGRIHDTGTFEELARRDEEFVSLMRQAVDQDSGMAEGSRR